MSVFSVGELDSSADSVACDELNELRAMTGEFTVPSSDVINALVMVAVFDPFPLVSTNKTVVGCWFARIDDITDDNVVAFVNCGFYTIKIVLNGSKISSMCERKGV